MGIKTSKSAAEATVGGGAAQAPLEVKVLLLGCGDSGKSTFFRQIEFLFARRDETASPDFSIYRPLIREQLLRNLASLLRTMRDVLKSPPPAGAAERTTANQVISLVAEYDKGDATRPSPAPATAIPPTSGTPAITEPLADKLTPVLGAAITRLWADKRLQQGYQSACRTTFEESLAYFFPEAERVAQPSYVPSRSDVMHLRVSTTGISEIVFGWPGQGGGPRFRIVDVGGQRSERKKWLRHFDSVDVVVFVANLAEYDLCLFEDATRRRLDESLSVWSDLCRNPVLSAKPAVLLLNKRDLFLSKLKRVPLRDHIPSYVGPADDISAAAACIRGLFDRVRRDLSLPPAVCLVASIIDPASAESAFTSIKDMLLSR